MNKIFKNKTAIVLFAGPAVILFTVVLFIPICMSIYYSFCDYSTATRAYTFIGLKNYTDLMKDQTMRTALKNSLFFLVFSCVSQLIMGLLLAGLLTNIKKGRNFFKNVIYLPCVLSSAALGLLWMFIFSEKLGINNLLKEIGIKGPLWMSDINGFIILPMWVIAFVALWQYVGQSMMLYMAQISGISQSLYEASYIDGATKVKAFRYITLPMWVIAFVALWQYVGQSMMLYMAQISGINKSLYEASYIDGATKKQAFRYITLPLVKPMIGTAMSLNAIGSLKFFDLIYSMLGDKTENLKMDVLATYLYRTGFSSKGGNHYGRASAIGVILVALCLIATAVINKIFKTENYEM